LYISNGFLLFQSILISNQSLLLFKSIKATSSMKNIAIAASRLSKKEQSKLKGGIMFATCWLFCPEAGFIRCLYAETCSGDADRCCVNCDGQETCA
jgi:hypothetical protein